MSLGRRFTISRFFCTKCGSEGIPIGRKIGSQRKNGHLKAIYCIQCKERVNHYEIRHSDNFDVTYQQFLEKFNNKEFEEESGEKI